MFRYLFTGYNIKDAEQADITEIVVYAANEGSALEKAAEGITREHYKTETVEEIQDMLNVDAPETD